MTGIKHTELQQQNNYQPFTVYNFSGRKVSRIGGKLIFADTDCSLVLPNNAMPPNFLEKTFTNNYDTQNSQSFFPSKNFPPYDTCTARSHLSEPRTFGSWAAEPGGLEPPQFLTLTRRRFTQIIGCFVASHASPPNHISVPPPPTWFELPLN